MPASEESARPLRTGKAPRLNITGLDESPTMYANNVRIRNSPWDISFDIGLLTSVSVDQVMVQNLVTVIMSPQHAKAFSEVLVRNLEKFEENFGPISVGRVDDPSAEPDEDELVYE